MLIRRCYLVDTDPYRANLWKYVINDMMPMYRVASYSTQTLILVYIYIYNM